MVTFAILLTGVKNPTQNCLMKLEISLFTVIKIIGILFGLAEHHFNHEGMESCPNPLVIGTDIAARTKNIRIGQAANIITFHNPS